MPEEEPEEIERRQRRLEERDRYLVRDRDEEEAVLEEVFDKITLMLTLLQAPKLLMLDEPDSGVDVENLALVGSAISSYLSEDDSRSAIIITHTGYIGKYIKAMRAYVMVDGRIVCRGDPEILVSNILEHGFEKCFKCEGIR
jgi:Fe-S cluster assembly ATP-binding protein